MADVNANIGVNIDTSDALNQLKNLQRQISQFHQSVAKSSSTAAVAQRDLQKNFVNSVNAIQGFSAELRTVRSTAESFTNSLEKNKFSIREYFRYAAGATKTFGKNFTAEFSTIERTAIERVKTLQTQYIKMGRDATGAMKAIAIRPTVLDMKDLGTQTAIAAQKQVLFNQLVKQGSTNLLNFGKNTQWAGRQLMVGFTLPLATLGMTAGRVFMDMEKAAIKFKKVYGDLFTAPEETQKAMDAVTELGLAYTKYGVAVSDSLSVAADAAAAGFQGVDLQNQTTASLKLSVLGQMELQKALETTIALQNAFQISSQELTGTIDFLNAVENQTVVSLDDITEAVPRVATVIQSLGGDVKDLAFFLAAMKEGGVNAAQGANALKSGLASLINPTERASEMLMGMGVNIRAIVAENEGDLRGLVLGVARSLDTLDPTNRARAIEQLFGKFQFARISALFDNVIREGSQASRVLDLAGSSLTELADLSEKELGTQAASSMNKFTSAIERIKVALVPLGQLFLDIATPFIDFGTKVLEAFNSLPKEMKQLIGTVITVVGGLGPVLLMTFGLINNGIANMIKFFATVRLGYLKMTGQAQGIGDETQYMTQEQLEAAAAASSLDQAHAGLTQRFTAEKTAVDALRVAYEAAAAAGARFATLNAPMMKPGYGANPTKMAKGGVVTVGGRGNKDTEPALLTPGEAVIPAAMVKKYQPLIEGMIAGNIPGYSKGFLGMPKSSKSVSKNRDAAEEVYQMFLKSSYANTAPTEYGHQISPTSGHSFPIFGLGGVYQKGDKQVFVKPVLDEKAALAEMRSTEISRRAHGLEAPEQRIVVMRDPMDVKRQRRFLALESDLDPKFVNNEPMGVFNEEQYFRQLVASLLRVDKDLSGSNVYGNVVADAGPSGVFSRASGLRDYEKNLPSMEEQAIINLLGIKGGAKRAFAESTLGLMAGLTPEQYHQRMLGEIQKVLPRLKQTIASFGLTNPTEVGVYDDMIRRLEAGLGVDWSKFHSVHSAVKPPKPKAGTQTLPGYKNGVVSVPGPKGKGDVVAAMLSPGEAVIPAAMAKKYAPLIQGMVAGNIPGYANGLSKKTFGRGGEGYLQGSHLDVADPKNLLTLIREITKLGPEYAQQVITLRKLKEDGTGAFEEITLSLEELIRRVDDPNNKEYDENTQLQIQGQMYGGTAMLEPEARNQAYRVAGYGGVPTTPEGLLEASRMAEEALLSDSRDAQMNAVELQKLVDAREAALEASTSADKKLDFTLGVLEKAYSQGIQASGLERDVAKANAMAAEKMARIRQEYLVDLQQGMSAEEALTRAKVKAANATLMEASVQSPAGGPTLYSFEEGERSKITPLSTGRRGGTGPAGREARDVGLKIYEETAERIGDRTGEFAVETARESFKSYDAGLDINSPSGKFEELANSVEAGVDKGKPGAEKAGERLAKSTTQAMQNASGSAFGNINVKEPVAAVGNAPREVAAAMQKESTAARTFAGDIKASFANVRSNLSREMGFVREEFASIMQQIKQRFGIGGKELIQVAQNTNEGLLINGKQYGINYTAQAQGRDGALEAIVTKGTAKILSNALNAYNTGALQIPPVISDGIESQYKLVGIAGAGIASTVVRSMVEEARKGIPAGAIAAPLMGAMQGPAEDPAARATRMQARTTEQLNKIQQTSSALSQFAFGLSSASGIMSAFGMDLNGILPIISGVTGALFGLISVTQALAASQAAATVANKINMAGGGLSGIASILTSFKGGATGMRGFFNVVKGVSGAFKTLFPILSRLIIPLAVVGAAFAGFQFYNNLQEEARRKLKGLSDAADMSADKIKKLGAAAGAENVLEKVSFKTAEVSAAEAEPLAAADKMSADQVIENAGGLEEFKTEYADAVKAIEAAKGDQDRLLAVYQSMAIQFSALGMDGTQIQNIVSALKMAAGETDVVLDFKSFTIFNEEGGVDLTSIEARGKQAAEALTAAYDADLEAYVADRSKTDIAELLLGESGGYSRETSEAQFRNVENRSLLPQDISGQSRDQTQQAVLTENIAATAGELKSLGAAFQAGTITQADYTAATKASVGTLSLLGDESQNLTALMAKLEINPELTKGLTSIADKTKVLDAVLAGVDITEFADGLKSDDINEKNKALELLATRTAEATEEQENANIATNYENAVAPVEQQIKTLQDQVDLYDDVVEATGDAAFAQRVASDAVLKTAFVAALAQDALTNALGGTGTAVADLQAQVAELDALTAKVDSRAGRSGGGAPQKSQFEQTIEGLVKQRDEIKNNIDAYAKLRNANFGVAEASELAADSSLAFALANEKVGSKNYNELISKIKQVRKAQEELGELDPRVGTEQYNEAVGKLNAYFDSQEALMDAANESATKANRALIETLEDQIEGYNRQIGALERDLDKIAEKETAINKAYDEKTKALETVKKLNQDIINQQKSQLSIANALSQGDVSAAASAIQDARAQSAAAQGDVQGRALEAGRDAQINAVKEGGFTRAQIEEKIKGLKKNISDIEIGSLRTAQDAVKAADDANEKAKGLLEFKKQTREQWRLEALQVEGARAKAELYEQGVGKALGKATSLVAQWAKLNNTFTTTHIINEVKNTSAGSSSDSKSGKNNKDSKTTSFGGGGKGYQFLAGGGMVKPAFFAKGGFAKGTDTVPAMLTPGEFVVNRQATNENKPLLQSINNGSLSSLMGSMSQPIYSMPQRTYAQQGPSGISYSTSGKSESPTSVDNSVYNYNLSVSVEGSNLSANDVANQVMNKIKQVDAQRMRNQVVR
jgi:TP901 family phage tail tape measure protein